MPTHIGFLRAVNIGKRQYKTVDLRAALTAAGYGDVDSHIQTGNIRITSPIRSRAKIEAELEAVFLADRGFAVSTIVLSPAELVQVGKDADEIAAETPYEYGHYISFPQAGTDCRRGRVDRGPDRQRRVLRRPGPGRAPALRHPVPRGEAVERGDREGDRDRHEPQREGGPGARREVVLRLSPPS